jgi:hypothetical protein
MQPCHKQAHLLYNSNSSSSKGPLGQAQQGPAAAAQDIISLPMDAGARRDQRVQALALQKASMSS